MRWARLGIRARITGGSLLIAALISIVSGILIFSQVQRIVSDGQVAVLENVEAPYLTALALDPTESLDPPGSGQLVAVTNPAGLANINTLPPGLGVRLDELIAAPGTRTISVNSSRYLVRVTAVATTQGTWHVISASENDVQDGILNQVLILLITSIAAINLAFGAASWLIGSAVLSPVTKLRVSAASLMRSPGAELLPVGPARDEIADLAHTLNELIEQLRASAERERQVVSDASHEFRTPLAILQTQLELAQAEASSLGQMREDVGAAQATVSRLAGLATSMLELSRIDAQTVPGSATLLELGAELADAADRGRLHVGARDIQIDYRDDPGAPDARVAISPADFGRICDNLVSNALAAMDARGSVLLALTSGSDHVTLAVTDDAGGMEQSFLPHAFDRFSRADASRHGEGAGLGLAIVAGLVEVAGGSVALDNKLGLGLAVSVHLPTRAVHDSRRDATPHLG
ncbi:HAMP domain-containing sensor histidine kinase [Salinibacterium sp.]|uniref:sensor histidine kinase n=1 Tax=Salinibacterium sp. TaxID=1915057 RepID=UPI00286A92F4|nr:HAMP domain-containing sensor histidine kinase [Salinibacterium sp.]